MAAMNKEDFGRIVTLTPLVSIDLIVRNAQGQVLLGLRRNRPARGSWFVPGGRIRKNERLREALTRISRVELGADVHNGHLLGAFDHVYDDNALDLPGVGTHYVALGYACELAPGTSLQPDQQHTELRWWDLDTLLVSEEVHINTKRYFEKAGENEIR